MLSLHTLGGGWPWQAFLFLVAIAAAGGLVAGYRPRAMAAVSWVLLLSLHARNPMAVHAGHRLLAALLFWSLFLPLGRRAGTHLSVGSAAFGLQLAAVYWFGFSEKLNPAWLTERSAVYYALHLEILTTPGGAAIADHASLTRLLTIGTLTLEFAGPFLAVSPFPEGRWLAVVAFVSFHLGLGLTMRLGTFPWICAAAWLALVPGPGGELVRAPRWSQPIAAACLLLVAVGLRWGVPEPRHGAASIHRILWQLGAVQEWAMFAPVPSRLDGRWLVNGEPYPWGDSRWTGYLVGLAGRTRRGGPTSPAICVGRGGTVYGSISRWSLRPRQGRHLRRGWRIGSGHGRAGEIQFTYSLCLCAGGPELLGLAPVPPPAPIGWLVGLVELILGIGYRAFLSEFHRFEETQVVVLLEDVLVRDLPYNKQRPLFIPHPVQLGRLKRVRSEGKKYHLPSGQRPHGGWRRRSLPWRRNSFAQWNGVEVDRAPDLHVVSRSLPCIPNLRGELIHNAPGVRNSSNLDLGAEIGSELLLGRILGKVDAGLGGLGGGPRIAQAPPHDFQLPQEQHGLNDGNHSQDAGQPNHTSLGFIPAILGVVA